MKTLKALLYLLFLFIIMFSSTALFSQGFKSPGDITGIDSLELQNIIAEKSIQARAKLIEVSESLEEMEKMAASGAIDITEGELEEIRAMKKNLKDNILSFQTNVYMIINLKYFKIWINISWPPKMMVLNPITPLNQGIILSRLATQKDELPIVFVFGHYHETVNMYPYVNLPIALFGVGAKISDLGDAAFTVQFNAKIKSVFNFRYSIIGGFEIYNCANDRGGAFFVNNSKVLVVNNLIHNCTASEMGGAIYCIADMEVPLAANATPYFIANEIYNNSAPRGGGMAFFKDAQSVSIVNRIRYNSATDMGGGVHFEESSNSFANNWVSRNSTQGYGGGMSFRKSGNAMVAMNKITHNQTPNNGGGVWVTRGGSGVPPFLIFNTINENTAGFDGGGVCIENEGDAVLLLNDPIHGNTAVRGGGVSIRQASIRTALLGNTIDGNTADVGGGIWAEGFDHFIIAGEIHGNKATYTGGGIHFEGGEPYVSRADIASNNSPLGGGIYGINNPKPTFRFNIFRGNDADIGAGMYLVDGLDPGFEMNAFAHNIANDKGGGLYMKNVTSPRISDGNNFFGNIARFGGGYYFEDNTTPNIQRNKFQENKAKFGGGIYVNYRSANIQNNEFNKNETSANGAAIFVPGGMSPTINNNIFKGNIAGSSNAPTKLPDVILEDDIQAFGGAIFTGGEGANPVITENLFQWNEATMGGAVAVVDTSKPIIDFNDYVENYGGLSEQAVPGIGGGIYVSNTEIQVRESNFIGNYATMGAGAACLGESKTEFMNNNFWWNVADIDSAGIGKAGGIFATGDKTEVLIGKLDSACIFKENFSAFGGAVAAENKAHVTIQHDSLMANRAAYNTEGAGGAVFLEDCKAVIGGNAAAGYSNIFTENTAGSNNNKTIGSGGAIAAVMGAETDVQGNYFFDHNAANKYGGSIYLGGSGTSADIGGVNDDAIIHQPFDEMQYGNVIQNNNRAFNTYPKYRQGSGVIEIEEPDTNLCELEEPPEEVPDSLTIDVPVEYDGSPTISVCVTTNYLPGIFAMTANMNGGIRVVDISDFGSPYYFDSLLTDGSCHDIALKDSFLLSADFDLGVIVYSIAPLAVPLSPYPLDTIEIADAGLYDIEVIGDMVYVLGSDNNIYIIQQTGPAFELVGTYTPGIEDRLINSIEVDNGRLYSNLWAPSGSELEILGPIGNSLESWGGYVVPGFTTGLHVYDNIATLTYAYDAPDTTQYTVTSLDVSDPTAIVEIAPPPFEQETALVSVNIEGDYAFMGQNDGIRRVGLYDGTNDLFETGSPALETDFFLTNIIVAQGYDGLGIYDLSTGLPISNLEHPVEESSFEFELPSVMEWDEGLDTNWTYELPELPDTVICEEPPIYYPKKNNKESILERINLASLNRGRYVYDVLDTILTESGGAIAINDSAKAEILGNLMGGFLPYDGNKALKNGGAVYVHRTGDVRIGRYTSYSGSPEIKNYILGNIANKGGAISVTSSKYDTVHISNNNIGANTDFAANIGHLYGGGIHGDTAKLEIDHNIINYNLCGIDSIPNSSKEGFGGGIALISSESKIHNNWVLNNFSYGNAGGIGLGKYSGKTDIRKNTISGNYAIRSQILAVEDTLGIGTDLFIGGSMGDITIKDNIFDHYGVYQSYSIYVDSSRKDALTYTIDISKLDISGNDVYNNTGFRYGGLITDLTGNDGSISENPQFVDPRIDNYNVDPASPVSAMGWNPMPGATNISSDVYNVPGNYSSISKALENADYGDRIVVHPNYDSKNETFPILMKDGIVLTGTAFDPLDLNKIESTVIEGNGSNIIEIDSTGPRTVIAGLTIKGGEFGILANNASGIISGNLLYDNTKGIGLGFMEDTSLTKGLFRDRIYLDHNTIEDGIEVHYDTLGEEHADYGFVVMNKIQYGPVLSYNIASLEANIVCGFDIHDCLTKPPLSIAIEKNDFWPDDISGYYSSHPNISDGNLVMSDPVFFAPGYDYHLLSGSSCLLVDSVITVQKDTMVFLDNYTGLIGALYAQTLPYFYADTMQGPPGLEVTFTDTSRHTLPYDEKVKTWYFGNGDSVSLTAPAYPYDVNYTYPDAGAYDVTLKIRDRYATFIGKKNHYMVVDTSWKAKESSARTDLNGVFFADRDYGWIVGNGGTILNTTDGGSTWSSQNTQVVVINNDPANRDGWSNQSFTLLRPEKGDDEILADPVTGEDLHSVYFIDRDYGWIAGSNGVILSTTNGGAEWILESSGSISALYGIFFTDINNGRTVGETGTILVSTDAGKSWEPEESPGDEDLYAIFMIDQDNAWIVGSAGTILHFNSETQTWEIQESGTNNDLYCVFFSDLLNGWAAGGNGTVLSTTDGGVTWLNVESGTDSNLYSIIFTDENSGWAVGEGGVIIYTGDGGITWNRQYSSTGSDLRGVFFTDETTGWAVGDEATILSTENGGISTDIRDEFLSKAISLYPNPFIESVTLDYYLPVSGHVRIIATDIFGLEKAVLCDEYLQAGRNWCSWNGIGSDGEQLENGMYYIKIEFTHVNNNIIRIMPIVKVR